MTITSRASRSHLLIMRVARPETPLIPVGGVDIGLDVVSARLDIGSGCDGIFGIGGGLRGVRSSQTTPSAEYRSADGQRVGRSSGRRGRR